MNTLYWLSVLGNISVTAEVFLVISSIALAASTIGMVVSMASDEMETFNIVKKVLKVTIPIFVISLLLKIFIPSTKDLYIIYGVGSTIDYLKSNPTAKQLPDKYINLLDAWAEEMIDEQKDKENK